MCPFAPYQQDFRTDGRQYGNYLETGLEEINGDLREADFWPGITSCLPVIRQESVRTVQKSLPTSRLSGSSPPPITAVHPRFSANFGPLPRLSFITFGQQPFNFSYFEAASKRVYSSICGDQNACSIHGGSHSWTHLKPCDCFWLYVRCTATGGPDHPIIDGLD